MEIEAWQAQLRKGAAELAVLAVLSNSDGYGLAILDRLAGARSLGIAEGSIYPLLSRLQKAGKIESRWVEEPGASHPRKYYRLTADGRRTLDEMHASWSRFRDNLDNILDGRR